MIQRLLIVGSGSAGKRHLEVGRRLLPRADIRVLQNRRSGEVPLQANGRFHEISEALRFSPQAAVVANPAPFHLEIAAQLVSINCHTLIEKPLSDKSCGITDLIKKIEIKNLIFQVGYNLRFFPSLNEFRRLIKNGLVGRPLMARCEVGQALSEWRPGTNYRTGVSARSDLGGGVLLELSHEIDYLNWIFGQAKWIRAWTGKLSDMKIKVEDTALLTIGYQLPRALNEIISSVNLDFHRADSSRTCVVVGTKGSLRWNGLLGTVEIFKRGSLRWKKIFSRSFEKRRCYENQFNHFLDCLKYNKSPVVDIRSGLSTVLVVEAARRSVKNKGKQCVIKKHI